MVSSARQLVAVGDGAWVAVGDGAWVAVGDSGSQWVMVVVGGSGRK